CAEDRHLIVALTEEDVLVIAINDEARKKELRLRIAQPIERAISSQKVQRRRNRIAAAAADADVSRDEANDAALEPDDDRALGRRLQLRESVGLRVGTATHADARHEQTHRNQHGERQADHEKQGGGAPRHAAPSYGTSFI